MVSGFKRVSCAVALAVMSACAGGGGEQGWAVSRSRNVQVFTEAQREHEFIQEWLELSHAAYSVFFPQVKMGAVDAVWLKTEPGALTRIYSPFDDPQSGWTFEGLPSDGAIGKKGLIVLERTHVPDGLTWTAIRDESPAKRQMAHLFIMRAVPMAPLWLQVGLGRYLEKFRMHRRGDYWIVCFGSEAFDETPPLGSTGSGRTVALGVEDVWNSGWYEYDRKRRRWYEHTAYALVHYLIHGENGTHRSRFPVLLEALRAGRSTPDALALAYPHILEDEWDERLLAHMRPSRKAQVKNRFPDLPQGNCQRIPPVHWAEERPERAPADAGDIHILMSDLERVDPFRRHAGWWPRDIVEGEAMRRPGGRERLPDQPAGGDRERAPGSGRPGTSPPDDDTPTVTVPVP